LPILATKVSVFGDYISRKRRL